LGTLETQAFVHADHHNRLPDFQLKQGGLSADKNLEAIAGISPFRAMSAERVKLSIMLADS
jgi:hypothetical protein